MSACREVKQWITSTIIVPVARAITEAKKTCENIDEWVEEQIQQPVESWPDDGDRYRYLSQRGPSIEGPVRTETGGQGKCRSTV